MRRECSTSLLLLAATLAFCGLHAVQGVGVPRVGPRMARGLGPHAPARVFRPHAARGERPGVCPPERKGNPQNQFPDSFCQKDEDCPLVEKCCSDNKGKFCKAPAKERPGKCPIVYFKEADIKNRQDFCSSDSECADRLKCCLTKTGRKCEPSIKAKPGSCPGPDMACYRGTLYTCENDSGCEAHLKCCRSKCGMECVPPN